MEAKQVIVLLLEGYGGASFGMISIIIPHCLGLINRYHYVFVPSRFIPAMEYKIMHVYFFKGSPVILIWNYVHKGKRESFLV